MKDEAESSHHDGSDHGQQDDGSRMPADKPRDLKDRTREYALRIIRLYTALPKTTLAQILGKQALRSGTSVGAQYREAHRGKSDADLVSKLEVALQELEETDYWLELLGAAEVVAADRMAPLRQETEELISILVTIVKKTKARRKADG